MENKDEKKEENKEAAEEEYIIPFIHRKSLLLSISFRSLNLEMGEFIMKVESLDKKETLITGECETTMVNIYINIYIIIQVPKFQIDFKNKTLNYLNKTKYPKYTIFLLNKNKEEIHKFNVDLGRLSFLGKELRNVSIYYYPIIIFEFMTGYFTTEELFEKNNELSMEFTKDFEIVDISSLKPNMQSKSGNLLEKDIQRNIESKNSNEVPIKVIKNINNEVQKNEKDMLTKSVLPGFGSKKALSNQRKGFGLDRKGLEINPKIQCTKYSDYIKDFQMLIYLINPQENIKETNPNFGNELEIFNDNLEKYKRKLRILEMEKEIEFLKRKNEAIKELNKDLEEAIKHKNENLEKASNQLKPNQVNYNNKLTQLRNNLNGRGQYQLIYDSFVYQKMAEICFVFFNNKIQSLYSIPPFYNEPFNINDAKRMERFDYYNKDKKNISAMLGHICQLLIYLSKTFNIPLRFPIFLNGSKSYILRNIKDKEKSSFLPLHFDAKKDDKHGSFENALNYLKDDIKEIFNFLSMFPEIISKADNENVNNMNGKYLFFFFFVVFNHSLFRFMKTLQNAV